MICLVGCKLKVPGRVGSIQSFIKLQKLHSTCILSSTSFHLGTDRRYFFIVLKKLLLNNCVINPQLAGTSICVLKLCRCSSLNFSKRATVLLQKWWHIC